VTYSHNGRSKHWKPLFIKPFAEAREKLTASDEAAVSVLIKEILTEPFAQEGVPTKSAYYLQNWPCFEKEVRPGLKVVYLPVSAAPPAVFRTVIFERLILS